MLGVRILDGYASSRASRRRQADIIRLLLLTGCRKGEIVNLRWREVEGLRKVFLNTSARAVKRQRTDRAHPTCSGTRCASRDRTCACMICVKFASWPTF